MPAALEGLSDALIKVEQMVTMLGDSISKGVAFHFGFRVLGHIHGSGVRVFETFTSRIETPGTCSVRLQELQPPTSVEANGANGGLTARSGAPEGAGSLGHGRKRWTLR